MKFREDFYVICFNVKWQIVTHIVILLQFTINVRKIPPSASKNSATRVRRWRRVCLVLSFTCLYGGSSVQNPNEQFVSCIHLFLFWYKLPSLSRSRKGKKLTDFGLEVETACRWPLTIGHMFAWPFYLEITDTVTRQNIDSRRITLCFDNCVLVFTLRQRGT